MVEEEDTLLSSIKEDIKAETGPTKEVEDKEEQEVDEVTADEEEQDAEIEKAEVEESEEEDQEPTRGQTRHQRLANQLKEERAERAKDRDERDKIIAERAIYAAQLEQIKQQQYAGQSAAAKRAEEERLSLLDPTERAAYNAQQKANNLEYRLNQMELQRQDDRDRSEFTSKAAKDPLVEKYKDRVESMLQEDRKKGFSASRESYLNFIVGEAIRKDAEKKYSAKKDAAGKRIDTVTSRPAKARGDVTSTKKGKTEEDRLRGVLI
jgi:hypothetical protein